MKKMLFFIVSIALFTLSSFTVKEPATNTLAVKHGNKALTALEVIPIDLSENNFSFHYYFSGSVDDATLVSQIYNSLAEHIAHEDGVGFTISYGVNADTGQRLDPSKSLRDNGIQNPGGILVYGFVG
jgi:hypothetical protein